MYFFQKQKKYELTGQRKKKDDSVKNPNFVVFSLGFQFLKNLP